jgi:hypothetical protein
MGSQNQHFLHEFKVVLQNWSVLANSRRFFLRRRMLLLLTCRGLHVGAFLTPKNNAFNMLMRFFALDLAIPMLKLASAGLVASYIATMIKAEPSGPQL